MVKANKYGQMELHTKDNGKMEGHTARANSLMSTRIHMKENGSEAYVMARVSLSKQK